MKLFFTYLLLSILLVICCLEKKFASSVREPANETAVSEFRHFVGKFASNNKFGKMSPFSMKLRISHSFVKGTYRPVNSDQDFSLFGSVNSQNELIMIESTNGKTTGTFKGKLLKGHNHLLRLSGIWTSINAGSLCQFSVDEVSPDL